MIAVLIITERGRSHFNEAKNSCTTCMTAGTILDEGGADVCMGVLGNSLNDEFVSIVRPHVEAFSKSV